MNWRKPVIYSLLYLSGSKIPKNLREIKKIENKPKVELEKYQNGKLRSLLLYAWENVPYYNQILEEANVVNNGKVSLNNFNKIPILTKEIIRREGKNIYSKKHKIRNAKENTSGGSTGEPIRLLQDNYYLDFEIANKINYKLTASQDIGEKELRFWGSERDLLEGKESLKIRLRNWLYNRIEFNTFKMSDKEMNGYVKKWNKYRPSWVESYVQSIYEFAKFIERNKLSIYPPTNGILTSAGTLYPEMKKTIERVFNCKVYNRYGSREVGDMAFGQDTLKISSWNNKIEILDEKGISEKKEGRIIVTNLNNYSMPLIRYDIGDIGTINKEGTELLKINGRINNMIKTTKGIVDSAAITSALYFDTNGKLFTSFSKYQLIQKKKDEFEFKVIVVDKLKWKDEKKSIEKVMKAILGKKIKFNFNEVTKIDSLKNGKYEYIKSEVKNDE